MPHKIESLRHDILTRNILAHGYDRVNYEILWDAATLELNSLRHIVDGI